jgi:hypothetical protein
VLYCRHQLCPSEVLEHLLQLFHISQELVMSYPGVVYSHSSAPLPGSNFELSISHAVLRCVE